MSNDEFFNNLKQWSERKHRLLENYLHPFVAKTGNRSKEVHCIDAFAGAARYEDGKEGSPLLLARLANTSAAWTNPVSLKLTNIEAKKPHYESLCRETVAWVEKGVVTNLHGKFSELVPKIVDRIQQYPAFFFIDPYGPTDIPFNSLLPILERDVRATELFINFNVNGLRRLADCLHTREDSKADPVAIQKIVSHVTAILGSDVWKYYFEQNVNDDKRDQKLLSMYVNNLARYNYHVTAYPIRQALDSAPKYYMIYCTRHIDGVDLMSNFIRQEEDALVGESVNASAPLFEILNPLYIERQERINNLRKAIVEYFSVTKQATRKTCRQSLVKKFFGLYLTKDYAAVVKSLLDEGVIQSLDGRKRINDDVPLLIASTVKGETNGR